MLKISALGCMKFLLNIGSQIYRKKSLDFNKKKPYNSMLKPQANDPEDGSVTKVT